MHAVLARSKFPSQNVQNTMCVPLLEVEMSKKWTPLWREAHFQVKMYKNTPGADHFWQLRCRKSARRCGAKHISQVKMLKTHQVRTTFGGPDVEKGHAVVARSTFRSQKRGRTKIVARETPCLEASRRGSMVYRLQNGIVLQACLEIRGRRRSL